MNDPKRPLTDLEQKIKDYIGQHPGLTAYDVAIQFDHSEEAYQAIAFLMFNLHVRVDNRTGALTPYE